MPTTAPVAMTDAGSGERPEHGGVVAAQGPVRAEVVAAPDGRVLAYVSRRDRAPVGARDVRVALRKEDGETRPVAVAFDPAVGAWAGRVAGVRPGPYPFEVTVGPPNTPNPVRVVTAPVAVTSVPLPPPQHRGEVLAVGDRVVEVVTSRAGNLALYWMDFTGAALPASQVAVPNVTAVVDGLPRVVELRTEGDHHVGRVAVGRGAEIALTLPAVTIDAQVYTDVALPHVALVAFIPGLEPAPAGGVALPTPPPNVARPTAPMAPPAQPAQPAAPVVVAPPAQPAAPPAEPAQPAAPVVVAPPAQPAQPAVEGEPGRPPRGRARGWWRNRGGLPPGAVEQPNQGAVVAPAAQPAHPAEPAHPAVVAPAAQPAHPAQPAQPAVVQPILVPPGVFVPRGRGRGRGGDDDNERGNDDHGRGRGH